MASVLPIVQEFQPIVETVQEKDYDTILLHLPGFTKEQLRVQLTRTKNLIISGERRLEQPNVLSRFRKEFPLSTNVDANKITAKFEGNILFIRQPKLITPAVQQPAQMPPLEPAVPPKPLDEPQPEKKGPAAFQQEAQMPPLEPAVPQKPLDEPQPEKKGQEQADESVKPLERKLKSKDSESVPDKVAEVIKEKIESVSASEGEKSTIVGNGKMGGHTTQKLASDSLNRGKRTLENYMQSVGGVAKKLKKPRKVMNVLAVVLMAIALGIFVKNYFKPGKTDEIADL